MANDLYEKDNHIKKLIEDSNKIIKEKLIEEGKFKDRLMNQIEKNNKLKKDNDDFYKYKNNVEIDIDIFKKNINSLKKENKQLKEDMKNFKDPETIKEQREELKKNSETMEIYTNMLNELQNEKINIRKELNTKILLLEHNIKEKDKQLKENEELKLKYEEKSEKYKNLDYKLEHYEKINKELEEKNNQYKQQKQEMLDEISRLRKDNYELYTKDNIIELEGKLKDVNQKLNESENIIMAITTDNIHMREQFNLISNKQNDIPILQNKLNALRVQYDELELYSKKDGEIYSKMKKEYDNKVNELTNYIERIKKIIGDKLKNDNIFHLNENDLIAFIEKINMLFNVDNEAVSEKFYTVNSGDKSENSPPNKQSPDQIQQIDVPDKLQQIDSNVSGKTQRPERDEEEKNDNLKKSIFVNKFEDSPDNNNNKQNQQYSPMQIEQSQKNQIEQSPKNIEDIEIRNQKAFDLVNGINNNDIDIMLDTLGFDNKIKGNNENDKKEAIYYYLKDNEKGKNMDLDKVKETFGKIKKIYDLINGINKNDGDAMIDALDLDNKIKGYNVENKKQAIYNFLKDNELNDKLN